MSTVQPIPTAPAEVQTGLPTQQVDDRVVIRPYPKIIIFYPTMIVALVCGCVVRWFEPQLATLEVIALVFFAVFLVDNVQKYAHKLMGSPRAGRDTVARPEP